MDRPEEPPTAGGTPPSGAVVDVPVGGPPTAGVVSAMIASTIPSKRKRIPKQFFEAPAVAADSAGEAPPAAKKAGRVKTKAAGPRGAAPAKVRTKAISRIGLAPPPPSKVTTPPPSVPAVAPPAPPPPTVDVDKVFDVESTTSYLDMLNESAPKYAQGRYKDMAGSKNKEFQFHHCFSILQHLPKWKLRDNEPKCKKEALLTMDDEAEDMSGRNTGKPEGNKKAKERVKVELEAASFREKLDHLMKSKEALTMKMLETKLLITEKKNEVKLAKVQARREDAKFKAELDMKMIAAKEAKAMKELLMFATFGDALYPYAVEQADTVFPSVLSCRAAPSLQAELPGVETPIDTSPVYVKGDPFGKTVYQDSETGRRRPDWDKKDVEPAETALDEVTKHVVETGLGEEHRGLGYLENYLTTGEVETLHLSSKAPTPQFIKVKKSKHGGRKFGPQPGEATIPRIGINGFGRIGSLVARLILHRNDMQMQLVAVNDPFVSAADMTISLKDMPPGLFPGIKVLDIVEPEQIPWAKVGGDYIVESTGIYTDTGTASAHLKGGAKKVVIGALSIDARIFVYGVNENTYRPDIDIISIADSPTICIALLAKVIKFHPLALNTAFGITDCHALSSIFPDLVGKFHVIVHPDPHVKLSCVEMTVKLEKCVDYEMIKNSVRMESAVKELRTLLANLEGGVVLKATDYLGDCRSCFFDADAGVTLGGGSFKLFAWFNHVKFSQCLDRF
ncbi:uncharacterized protein [Lolium perenne]|uniref:uncharacterized protein n=1 Tax=Lolium perenne TaxID=4522 RepID=UPI003A99631C